ncbi:hypothetical protein DL96DRAFT_1572289 [Flagelloscypha sp. PMI_526]|nr:hypothetical protein DL96DRAFT_1572289 [Flagelloscypha sp. PMI_526]
MARGASSTTSSPPDNHLKKRKRDSDADSHPRKRSSTVEPEDRESETTFSGDKPLRSEDAAKILVILENLDNQGLLERAFPLQGNEQNDKSLRTLLEEADETPLWVLRNAVNNLLPISTHPRSRPSAPAAQQAQFVQMALSLLDQSSRYNVPLQSFPEFSSPIDDSASAPQAASGRKYALFQKLPTGEYWSSLNGLADTNIKDLPTGHAELVAILPDPPLVSSHRVPTLGTYTPPAYPKFQQPSSRLPPHGSFIDYGSNTSFSPCFETSIGSEIHQDELAQFLYFRDESRRAKARRLKEKMLRELGKDAVTNPQVATVSPSTDIDMKDVAQLNAERWKGVISEEDMTALHSSLDTLEIEKQVQTLLDHNTKALAQGGIPAEGSEEWDTAHALLSSLTALTAIRPRASGAYVDDPSPLIPPPEVLHTLHRTLPLTTLNNTPGWQGNLPATRPFALRDDSTIQTMANQSQHQQQQQQQPAQANTAFYAYSAQQSPQTYGSYTPTNISPIPTTAWYNGASFQSPQPNGYHVPGTPVIANTLRPAGGYGSTAAAYVECSLLAKSFEAEYEFSIDSR